MEQALLTCPGDTAKMWRLQKSNMLAAMGALGCEFTDLYATCIYAYCSPVERYVHIRGDGAVAWKYPDGSVEMMLFDWGKPGQNNPPFYPAYAMFDPALAAFNEHYSEDSSEALYGIRHKMAGSDTVLLGIDYHSLEEGIEGIRLPIPNEAVAVAVFTDGVTRVPGLFWGNVIQELTAFKSMRGEFMKRRMLRFMEDYATSSSRPGDDLACAAINLQELS